MKELTSYNRVAGYLNKIFDLLNAAYFENALSRPTITIQSTPKAYGHFSLCDDTWLSKNGATHPCIDEESFFEKASDEYDADIHSWRDYYKEKNIYLQEELEDAYGVYQITTEATRVKNISINKLLDEEWEWINTLEGMNAFDSDTISAAKVVTVKCKVKGEDEVERTTLDVFVVKTGAMWKVLDFE